jgi:DNA-binding XRE family transcriptional regulator
VRPPAIRLARPDLPQLLHETFIIPRALSRPLLHKARKSQDAALQTKLRDEGSMAKPGPGGTGEDDDPFTEELRRNFGENLRNARVKAGMTQAQLADRASLTQQYISLVEIGRQNLTLSTMAMLARIFGKDVVAMLRRYPPFAQD